MKRRSETYIYSSGKHKKGDNQIWWMLLPSFLGIMLCTVCLVSLTWAWYTSNVQSDPITIQAANFDAHCIIEKDSSLVTADADGSYTLDAGEYEFLVAIKENSSASTGYCRVEINSTTYYTAQLSQEQRSLSFTLTLNEQAVVKITPVWGTYAADAVLTADAVVEIGTAKQQAANATVPEETTTKVASTPQETTTQLPAEVPQTQPEEAEAPTEETEAPTGELGAEN